MKNNTKLIMENWRKFLKEGPADEGDYTGLDDDGLPLETQDLVDEMPGELPPVGVDEDPDLEGMDFDPQAREDFQSREAIWSSVYEETGSEELADKAVEDSMQHSGEELERMAYPQDDMPMAGDDIEYTQQDALDAQGSEDFDERYGLPDSDVDDYDGEPPF